MTAGIAAGEGPRFGVSIAGVPVLLPTGTLLEYIAEAAVFPLPRSPRRVIGLLQLRGMPVTVFDPAPVFERPAPQLGRETVLVIGQGTDAGAVLVDAVPGQVDIAGADPDAMPAAGCVFAESLGSAIRDVAGRSWWPVDPRRLFEALAAETVAA